jgi:hypothetical protein
VQSLNKEILKLAFHLVVRSNHCFNVILDWRFGLWVAACRTTVLPDLHFRAPVRLFILLAAVWCLTHRRAPAVYARHCLALYRCCASSSCRLPMLGPACKPEWNAPPNLSLHSVSACAARHGRSVRPAASEQNCCRIEASPKDQSVHASAYGQF